MLREEEDEFVGDQPAVDRREDIADAGYACVMTVSGESKFYRTVRQNVWTMSDFGNGHFFYALFSGHDSPGSKFEGSGLELAEYLATELPKRLRANLLGLITNPEKKSDKKKFQNIIISTFMGFDKEKFAEGIKDDKEGTLSLDENDWFQGGSTAVCALVTPTYIHFFNLGDSRAIVIRQKKGESLFQLENRSSENVRESFMGDFRTRSRVAMTRKNQYPESGRINAKPDVSFSIRRTPDERTIIIMGTKWLWKKIPSVDAVISHLSGSLQEELLLLPENICEIMVEWASHQKKEGFKGDVALLIIDATLGRDPSTLKEGKKIIHRPEKKTEEEETEEEEEEKKQREKKKRKREEGGDEFVGSLPAVNRWEELMNSEYACVMSDPGTSSKDEPLRPQNFWTMSDLGNGHFFYALFDGHDSPGSKLRGSGKEVAEELATELPEMLRYEFIREGVATNPPGTREDFLTNFINLVKNVFRRINKQKFFDGIAKKDKLSLDDNPWFQGHTSAVCALVTPTLIHLFNLGHSRAIVISSPPDGEDEIHIEEHGRVTEVKFGKKFIQMPGAVMGGFAFLSLLHKTSPGEYPGEVEGALVETLPKVNPHRGFMTIERMKKGKTFIVMGTRGFWKKVDPYEEVMGYILDKVKQEDDQLTPKVCIDVFNQIRKKEPKGFQHNATLFIIDATLGVNPPPLPPPAVAQYFGEHLSNRPDLLKSKYVCRAVDRGKSKDEKDLPQQDVSSIWDLGNGHTLYGLYDGRDAPTAVPEKNFGRDVAEDLAWEIPKSLHARFREYDVRTDATSDEDIELFEESVKSVFIEMDAEKQEEGEKKAESGELSLAENPWFQGGSTSVCALVTTNWIYLFNLGHSRAIVISTRDPDIDEVLIETKDEIISKELLEIEYPGAIMGDFSYRDKIAETDGIVVNAEPTVKVPKQSIRRGHKQRSIIVMGTRGFWSKFDTNEQVMSRTLKLLGKRDQQTITGYLCENLLEFARKQYPEGFTENATVIVINATQGHDPPPLPPPKEKIGNSPGQTKFWW